jgi:hypothetical protein
MKFLFVAKASACVGLVFGTLAEVTQAEACAT